MLFNVHHVFQYEMHFHQARRCDPNFHQRYAPYFFVDALADYNLKVGTENLLRKR